jgi:MYXO-CTERM domain-containing protein
MEAIHASMGLAELPKGPVFDSVMRQVSLTYGLHGVALWLIAADVARYRPLAILTAFGYLIAGPVSTAGNGGSCLLVGLLLLGLLWGKRRSVTNASAISPE